MMQRQALIIAVIFTATIIQADNGHYRYADADLHLGNLGTVISQRVAHQMSDLTTQLNRQLAGFNSNLQAQLSKLNNELQVNMHGISQNVRNNVHGLTQTIEHRVQQSLAPVNALMIKSAMAQGIGGVTVVLYGGGIQHIIMDGNPYTCPGEIVKDQSAVAGVRCTANLEFHPPDHLDVCTESSYSRINDLYCFGNYASLVCVDSACQCRGGVMHTVNHLRNMCGMDYGTSQYAKYDYYPDRHNVNHIPVPHSNKYVTCENAGENHCVWHGNGFVMAANEYTDNV
ncbi:hypothetical protein CBL_20613 [Carabus blaptoides fortunei]